ncbi:MAG: sulfur carrier protein ThiS [Endomicrobium sp.]|jgi:sulfur carrier protein|nr:sulfur carrier protein ThiS [Endomicrobium sp.]
MITVKINGQNKEIEETTTIFDFLKMNDVVPIEVTLEYNLKVISYEDIKKIVLKNGDTLEVLRFVGGG